jgi:hypothetical protein
MARAYRGPYARPSEVKVPYATASVWGTGIDAIHGYYGEGPPLRVLGRNGAIGSSPVAFYGSARDDREYQEPGAVSGYTPPGENLWGYPGGVDYSPDSFGMGADSAISDADTGFAVDQYMADRPSWDTPPENDRIRQDASTMPPWGTGGARMRAKRAGSHRFRRNPLQKLPGQGDGYQPISAEPSNSNPTETVSEGWLNKVTSFTAYSQPSADAQIFVQTSDRQRFGTRTNTRALLRDTDEPRSAIASRVMAMVEKVYSEGERIYDMAPYQQDEIRRPFHNRTAGTGPQYWMRANEFSPMLAYQRTPPPDPSMGVPEVSSADDYGYTGEDTMFYG